MLKLKKPVKIPLIIIISLLGFLGLTSIIVPPIAKHYVEKHSKQICHRTVKMEKFRVNLFTGKASITKFQSWEENDKDLFLTFDTLSVRMNWFKLLTKEVCLNEIRLISHRVPILQNGNVFNFTDIIKHFTKEQKDTTPSKWSVNLRNITIRNGNIIYQDLQRGSNLALKELALYIPGVYFGPGNTDVGLHLKFENGGELGVKLLYALENKSYTLNFNINKFAIASLQPYIQEFLNIQSIHGELSAQLHLEGNTDHITEIIADGTVNLHQFEMVNTRQESMLSFTDLDIKAEELNLMEYNMLFDSIRLDGLKMNFTLNKDYNTFSDFVKPRSSENRDNTENTTATDSSSKKQLALKVNAFNVNNGSVNFSDASLHRTVNLPVTGINISSNNFDLNDISKIMLKATIAKGGTLMAFWEGTIDGWTSHNLRLNISNFDLTQISPYCEYYMAYPIEHGTFALTSSAKITNAQLDNQNALDINKCDIGKKLADIKPEYNIPLRAGIFVLEDRQENIKIDLPISGNVSSPEFSLKKLILKAICNLIVKVATGPIDLLANAFGLNADDFKDMSYYVYDMDLESAHYTQMNTMAQKIKEKDGLSLVITHQYNLEENTKAMALYLSKRDYYLHSRPDKTAMSLGSDDIKAINAIRNENKDFLTYINSQTQAEGSIYDKAFALHPQSRIQDMMEKNIAAKENILKKYFYETAGLSEEKVSFENITKEDITNKNTFSFVVNYTPTDDEIDTGKQ
ncbi:MAG: DUF748 domain-containing protein [Bacteroidales bacterium]|nr:DUF748 domain-containing protein [Bacteroidales bacterium]